MATNKAINAQKYVTHGKLILKKKTFSFVQTESVVMDGNVDEHIRACTKCMFRSLIDVSSFLFPQQ